MDLNTSTNQRVNLHSHFPDPDKPDPVSTFVGHHLGGLASTDESTDVPRVQHLEATIYHQIVELSFLLKPN